MICNSSRPDDWYALMVYTGREKWAAAQLHALGFPQILLVCQERRTWSDREKTVSLPVFPGYLFCQFDVRESSRLLSVPGVLSVVSIGTTPAPIERDEIQALQLLHKAGQALARCPYLQEGDLVRIEGGSLDGLEGRFAKHKSEDRIIVSITLLQRSVAVEHDHCRVVPVRREAPVHMQLKTRAASA